MDLFFLAGDILAGRSCARSESPLHGCWSSIRNQTVADHDHANFRRNVDRPVRNHQWRAHRAYHHNLSLRGHDSSAKAIARGAEARSSSRRALEFLANLARIQSADAPVAFA